MFRIKVNSSKAVAQLKRFQKYIENSKPLYDKLLVEVVISMIRQIFISNGFGTWRRTKRPNPILRDTYALYRSYTQKGAIGNIYDVTNDGLFWGSDLEYAQYHESGTRDLHPRKVIGLLTEQRIGRKIERSAEGWLQAGIKREGLA